MKWSIQQLNKFFNRDHNFEATFDFSEYIKNIDDIVSIKYSKVNGLIHVLDFNKFRFDLHIDAVLVLEDAVTLEPVDFHIEVDCVEHFATEDDGNEDLNIINTNTLDLEPIVWEIILLEKPIRYTKE